MRVAWVTAFSPRSGIAEFSRQLTPAIALHADVEIWTPDDPPLLESELPIVRFGADPQLEETLGDYDVVVYNMGNTVHPHRTIHQLSQRQPGIVILHDHVLHPMFVAAWLCDGGFTDSMYVSRMAAYYGETGAGVARESLSGARPRVWESDEVVEYPLVEQALQRALGAVTHSQVHAQYIREHWFGPVRALQNPTYRDALTTGTLAGPAPPARSDGRLQLTTIGHVTANKQCHRVIELLAEDHELAARTHYTIAGPLDDGNAYAAELAALARSLPQVSVEILGWREEPELGRLMAATDAFINLRHPTIESGSASLMLELAYGRPILCFDAGAFGDLPPDALVRVPAPDFDAARSELKRLVSDAGYRRRLGENARHLAGERSEAAYAQGFIEFVAEVQRCAPALTLLDRVATELGVMRADPLLPVFDTIADDFGRVLSL
jgi:glycosyltransferase involved in cell wall biosynthesis